MNRALVVLFIVFLSGCATAPPATYDFESQKNYIMPYDGLWKHLTRFFDDREIPLHTAEKDYGIIVTEELNIPYRGFRYNSEYSDCGRLGGFYVFREIIGKFNVVAKEINDITTSVRVNTSYRASKWYGERFEGWVICQSRGHVEKTFFEGIDAQIKAQEEEKKKKLRGQ
jgi:hypothetical protein